MGGLPVRVGNEVFTCMHPDTVGMFARMLWKNLPVRSSDRLGQHTGVCAKKLVKLAPRAPRCRVKDMAFIEPSTKSWFDEHKHKVGHKHLVR